MPRIVEYPKYRVAADLAATVQFNGPAIPCRGAAQVTFFLKCADADADTLVNPTIQVRRNGGAWKAAGAAAAGTDVQGTATGVMNTGGIPFSLHPANTTALRSIPGWDECRFIATGHAANTISAFEVAAQVVVEGEGVFTNNGITS